MFQVSVIKSEAVFRFLEPLVGDNWSIGSVFETGACGSHTRTLDEDVFAPFLQAIRKRRYVVQTKQRGFAGKETTPDNETLGIVFLDRETCRFKHETDIPGLAGPQTHNTEFSRELVF